MSVDALLAMCADMERLLSTEVFLSDLAPAVAVVAAWQGRERAECLTALATVCADKKIDSDERRVFGDFLLDHGLPPLHPECCRRWNTSVGWYCRNAGLMLNEAFGHEFAALDGVVAGTQEHAIATAKQRLTSWLDVTLATERVDFQSLSVALSLVGALRELCLDYPAATIRVVP